MAWFTARLSDAISAVRSRSSVEPPFLFQPLTGPAHDNHYCSLTPEAAILELGLEFSWLHHDTKDHLDKTCSPAEWNTLSSLLHS